jgi:hypothetical protein
VTPVAASHDKSGPYRAEWHKLGTRLLVQGGASLQILANGSKDSSHPGIPRKILTTNLVVNSRLSGKEDNIISVT